MTSRRVDAHHGDAPGAGAWQGLMIGALVVGVVVRAWAVLGTKGFIPDVVTFAHWGVVLRDHPMMDFYAVLGDKGDHLPGDIIFHWLLVRLCGGLGIAPNDHAYLVALKAVPAVADIVAAWVTWVIVRHARPEDSRSQAWAFVFMLLAPSSIAISAAWGQWDMVSMLILLLGMLCLQQKSWWLAPVLFGWCCIMKPPLALAVAAILGVWLVRLPMLMALRRAVSSVLLALGSVLVAGAPFGVGFSQLGARYSLFDRISVAQARWNLSSMGAANPWGFQPTPDSKTLAGVPLSTIGNVLLLCCLVFFSLRLYLNRHRTTTLIGGTWLAAMFMWSYYMCQTRCHERYLLPASVLLLLYVALSGWRWRRFVLPAAVSTILFVSVVVHLISWLKPMGEGILQVLSALSIGIFLAAAVTSRPGGRHEQIGFSRRGGVLARQADGGASSTTSPSGS